LRKRLNGPKQTANKVDNRLIFDCSCGLDHLPSFPDCKITKLVQLQHLIINETPKSLKFQYLCAVIRAYSCSNTVRPVSDNAWSQNCFLFHISLCCNWHTHKTYTSCENYCKQSVMSKSKLTHYRAAVLILHKFSCHLLSSCRSRVHTTVPSVLKWQQPINQCLFVFYI